MNHLVRLRARSTVGHGCLSCVNARATLATVTWSNAHSRSHEYSASFRTHHRDLMTSSIVRHAQSWPVVLSWQHASGAVPFSVPAAAGAIRVASSLPSEPDSGRAASGVATQASLRTLTPEEALVSMRMVAETLESPDLDSVIVKLTLSSDDMTVTRPSADRMSQLVSSWHKALRLAQSVQMEAISRFGFEPSAAGLLSYETQLSKLAAVLGEDLCDLKRRKWQSLVSRCFGIEQGVHVLSVDEARAITGDIRAAVHEETFLTQLRGKLDGAASVTDAARRSMAAHELLATHIAVLSRHGYRGERGYVLFQAGLMEAILDRAVAENITSATSSVLEMVGC